MASGTNGENRSSAEPHIIVRNLTMAYGSFVLMGELNFVVKRGDILIIMGGSGCGKSRLLRHLIGLKEPATGEIIYGDINFTRAEPEQSERLRRRFGILYQSGALWSSMTLAENIGLPLGEFTDLTPAQIREIAALKLALVGLKGFEDFYPNQLPDRNQRPALRDHQRRPDATDRELDHQRWPGRQNPLRLPDYGRRARRSRWS